MKISWLIGIIFLNISVPCYAQIKLQQLYGLREKEVLQDFVQKIESEIRPASPDIQKFKMLGIAYHNLATLKEKDASRKAVEYLQKAWVLSPNDGEVQAYLGSAITMTGRDSWNVLTKIGTVNKGIRIIDDAVVSMPDSIVVRMVRAKNSLDIPDFFKRKEISKKDFQYLEVLITKASVNVDPDIKAEIFYQLGMFCRRGNNDLMAKEYFKKAINASPDSRWGKKSEGSLQP